MTHDVIVIGGGASGMMAAGRAAESGKRVLLLERNTRLGEKLRITGGGRCNITNAEPDTHALLRHFGTAAQVLHSAFAQFGMKDTFTFFESRNLPLKVEARQRAFPASERAADVCKTLEEYMKQGKVTVRTRVRITSLETKGNQIVAACAGTERFVAKEFILATGGVSHPETGSTGDGFSILKELGHTILDPTPTIVPLKVKEKWVTQASGTTLSGMKITFYMNNTKKFVLKGSLLFTHFGISGPLILNAAHKVADLLYEGEVTAHIDTRPSTDLGILDKEITEIFDANKNKLLKNVWKDIAPPGTGEALRALLPAIDFETKVHSVRKEDRRTIAELLKALPLTITGLMGMDRAVVADGGVPCGEINMRTMQSMKYENLRIIGDLLHITRPSGGYSLQLCWTTGQIAGSGAKA